MHTLEIAPPNTPKSLSSRLAVFSILCSLQHPYFHQKQDEMAMHQDLGDSVFTQLKISLSNERGAPEILPYQQELISKLKESIQKQVLLIIFDRSTLNHSTMMTAKNYPQNVSAT